jgi:four helix bundle protein
MGHLTGMGECMNNPEVTMHERQINTGFDAHDKAIKAAGIAISLVMRVPSPLKPIADQVVRSASAVPANLSEGAGRSGRDRLHYWRIAYGSAKEVDTHLHLLIGAGAIDVSHAEPSLQLFDDVRAMTWRLLHPKP